MREYSITYKNGLSVGLRASTHNPRNKGGLIKARGLIQESKELFNLDELNTFDISLLESCISPFPQMFQFREWTVVCTPTKVYTYDGSSLTLVYTAAEGSTWTYGDFYNFVIMSNGEEIISLNPESGVWDKYLNLIIPNWLCLCDLNGQLFIGGRFPASPSKSFEVYYEMLKSEIAIPHIFSGGTVTHLPSKISLNTDDIDGVVSWEFEAIWHNRTENNCSLQIVDELGNIYADLPMSSGCTGSNLFRTRVAFTPGVGDITYMLRFNSQGNTFLQGSPNDAVVATARIVLTQTCVTKTKLQIPMFSSCYNYALQNYEPDSVNCGIGWPVYDNNAGDFCDSWSDIYTDHIESKAASTIWLYDSDELSDITEVTFDVDAKGGCYIPFSRTQDMFGSLDILYFDLMLYWAPAGTSSVQCYSGVPVFWVDEYQVHTDDCTGAVFTPIPDSHIQWDGVDYPYNLTCSPDFSGVPLNAKIYIGGDLRIYNQTVPEPWWHTAEFFDNPTTTDVYLENVAFTIQSTSPSQLRSTFTADKWHSKANLTVALWNVTEDEVVSGSESVWAFGSSFSRQSKNILNLSSGCEYKIVAKTSDYSIAVYAPHFYDAQLLIKVNPITNLTIWRRVTHSYDGLWDNWSVPIEWNNSSIGSRIKLLNNENNTSYFEQTGFRAYNYGTPSIFLEDLGVDDSLGSGIAGTDVVGGELSWTDLLIPSRKRTDALLLVNEHVYDNRLPDGADKYLMVGTGFIVLRVK